MLIDELRFLFLIIIVWTSSAVAQEWADRTGKIRNQIENLVRAKYGTDFKDFHYTVFDTLILYSNADEENIQDPYGTLKGCVLFSTYKDRGESTPDTFIVGIVKNGQIIWDNSPGTKVDLGGDLLQAQDINKDGDVDLLYSEVDWELLGIKGPDLFYYYVLSWNGKSGRFINAFDSTGISVMEGNGGCDLVDKDGDGIQEIRTTLPEIDRDYGALRTGTFPYVTYGWNGMQYGLWSNTEQIAGDEFLPANRLEVTVRCTVQKHNDLFTYNYVVHSDTSSRQNISDIYIGGLEDTTSDLAPALWQSGSSSYIGGRAFIKYEAGEYYLIHPGQTLSGFQTVSAALPIIVNYHIQGYTPPIFVSEEKEKQNILNNSVIGYTLGTSDTSLRFSTIDFVDTIKSNIRQSHSLGWISQRSVTDKYLVLFDSAKIQLQRKDNTAARSTLATVMQHSVQDSSGILSSEAFALIFYNAKYLEEQLR